MTHDDPLVHLLREAVRPVPEPPSRGDLWSATCVRLEQSPTWSPTDLGLLAAVLLLLILFPQPFLLLAYFI